MNPTSNQIQNKSTIPGTTLTQVLNYLSSSGSGDMIKAVYDTNNNGKVDSAEYADSVQWSGITNKPITFLPSPHSHPISDVTNLQTSLDAKQAALVSGTNIKTVNGTSLLGSGNVSISGGGGLTLVELSTTSQTAANGSNYAFTNAAATTLTAPASPTVGMRFGWMICNNRTDNVINWNGAKHENISDATMTINGPNEVGEAEYINATFGWKVK